MSETGIQDFRNLVGGSVRGDNEVTLHSSSNSELTDDQKSTVMNTSYVSIGESIARSLNLDLEAFPQQNSCEVNMSHSSQGNSHEESRTQSPFQISIHEHYREHSFTRIIFDEFFNQFEGRYKANVVFSPQFGVTKSQVLQYEELSQVEEKRSLFKKGFNTKKKQQLVERVGMVQVILHGSCLYLFKQERNNSLDDDVRAIFILDHCQYALVPTEESTEAALDIIQGQATEQEKFRLYLNSEENRADWLAALQESSPYHSAGLICAARKDLDQLGNQLEQMKQQYDKVQSQNRYLIDIEKSLRGEFEAEKADYEEQIKMLQDEHQAQQQLKSIQSGEFHATVQKRDELESQIQQLIQQRSQMREERVALRRHCQTLENSIRDILQNGRDKEREFKTLQKQLVKQADLLEKVKRSADNYKSQAKEMPLWRQQAKELESINWELEDDIHMLEDSLEQNDCEKEKMQSIIVNLENQVALLLQQREFSVDVLQQTEQLDQNNVDHFTTSKTNSHSSILNQTSTTREVQNVRRKSDSVLEVSENFEECKCRNLKGGEMVDESKDCVEDSAEMMYKIKMVNLQQKVVHYQEKVIHLQGQLDCKQKQIKVLQNRIEAFDAFMENSRSSKSLLEAEVKRLSLIIEEMKRMGVKHCNKFVSAPADVEMIKDPAFHLEFVLQHATELVMENENLRTRLAELQRVLPFAGNQMCVLSKQSIGEVTRVVHNKDIGLSSLQTS